MDRVRGNINHWKTARKGKKNRQHQRQQQQQGMLLSNTATTNNDDDANKDKMQSCPSETDRLIKCIRKNPLYFQ